MATMNLLQFLQIKFHAALAGDLGPVDAIEPLYLRVPDAEKSVH